MNKPLTIAVRFTLDELLKLKAIAPRWLVRRVNAAAKTLREREAAAVGRRDKDRAYMRDYMRDYRAKQKTDDDEPAAPRRLTDEPTTTPRRTRA